VSEQLLRALVLALVCAVYLCVAVVTSRGFIVAPLRQVLLRQAESQALAITALEEQAGVPAGSSVAARATAAVLEQLRVSRSRLRRLWAWPFDTPLTKLYAEMVRLAAARRAMIGLVPDATVSAHVTVVLDRLATVDPDRVPALRKQIDDQTEPAARRVLVAYAAELIDGRPERATAAEFESQRVALWLAIVGLLAVTGIGLASPQHQVTLLFGAIGGFLAPLVRVSTGERAASWGVMVLSPVGGALTAVGGLLLVRLLSEKSINVLGAVFRNNSWDQPTSPLALATAVLFGFSGRLFSRLAIAGTTQLSSGGAAATSPPATAT
jgi:hypothetical protein